MENIGKERPLFVKVFPSTEASRVLIIAPAMGVSQRFYSKIAEYFAGFSYTVITFDYYGMLDDKKVRDDKSVTLTNFGSIDIQNVIEYAVANFPGKPICFLGHSIAGQVLPLARSSGKITAAFFVASQNVYSEYWEGKHKRLVNFFWHVTIPICVRIFGRLPGFTYGGKHSLHKQIALDWSHFARTKNGLMGSSREAALAYQRMNVPSYFLSLEGDDLLAPRAAVIALKESYGSKVKRHEHIGDRKNVIGHFDFFKEQNKTLWPNVHRWFAEAVRTETAQGEKHMNLFESKY